MAETYIFDGEGSSAPAYSCNHGGDQSGAYVQLSDYAALKQSHEELLKIVRMMSLRATVPPLAVIMDAIARAEEFQSTAQNQPKNAAG